MLFRFPSTSRLITPFVLFAGEIHRLQGSTARRTNRSLPKRMPWRTHWNRFRSYRNKPSASFCATHNRIYAGQRMWFRKGTGQGKEIRQYWNVFLNCVFNTIDQNKWLGKWKLLNLITLILRRGFLHDTYLYTFCRAKNSKCIAKLWANLISRLWVLMKTKRLYYSSYVTFFI